MSSLVENVKRAIKIMTDIREVLKVKNVDIPEGSNADDLPDIINKSIVEEGGLGSSKWWADHIANRPTLYHMFYNANNLVHVPPINAQKATSLSYMFANCNNLVSVEEINAPIASNVEYMFSLCFNLKTIKSINIPNATNMTSMFHQCYILESIPPMDTSKVTSLYDMFYSCYNLETVPIMDTSKVTNFSGAFRSCNKLESISFTEGSIKTHISFSESNQLSDDSISSIIAGLADMTGSSAKKIIFASDVANKLTVEQTNTITSKNWNIG